MPQLTGREYLNQLISLDRLLKSLESDLMRTRNDIMSLQAIDYSKDRIVGGKSVDLSDKIASLDEQTQVINNRWDELITLRNEARELIYKVRSPAECAILVERYLCNKSLKQIGYEAGYSKRQTINVHNRALALFDEAYQNCAPFCT